MTDYMLDKTTLFLAMILGVSATLSTTTTYVYAGDEWKDSCRDAGYDDGQNGPFSQRTYDHCGGDVSYYIGFIEGCMSVEGNTRDVCEKPIAAN